MPEVWFWQNRELALYALTGQNDHPITTSQFVADVPLVALATCAEIESRSQAVREFRAQLSG